jgi:hypothetical protein
MTKPTITRLFVGSLIAIVGGVVLLLAGLLAAVASGALITSGSEVTGFEPSAVGWTSVGFLLVGVLVTIGGAIGQFVAWIGAVVNTARLDDKLWFILLLVLGLMSFGLIAMLVYVLAGPDGTQPQVRSSQPA